VLGPELSAQLSSLYADSETHVVGPTNWLEQVWLNYIGLLGDFQGIVVFYFFMTCCYVLAGILWGVVDYFHLLKQYKIQPEVSIDNHLGYKCFCRNTLMYMEFGYALQTLRKTMCW
jgi:hypothetical protein